MFCQTARNDKMPGTAESEMSILLLDSAVPKQPLITLSWELRPVSRGCYYNIRASIREAHVSVVHFRPVLFHLSFSNRKVVSTRSSWAYRQHTWSLGDGTLRARPSENDVREYVLTYHLESLICKTLQRLAAQGWTRQRNMTHRIVGQSFAFFRHAQMS